MRCSISVKTFGSFPRETDSLPGMDCSLGKMKVVVVVFYEVLVTPESLTAESLAQMSICSVSLHTDPKCCVLV